jgi:hypothetical protein
MTMTGRNMDANKRFLFVLTPKTNELLEAAHKELEMSRAAIINNALKYYLKDYEANATVPTIS